MEPSPRHENLMNPWSHPLLVRARAVGRYVGANRLLACVFGDKDYEHRFDRSFLAQVKPGDCVWDIGANRGLYTERLSASVGSAGRVVAFEPSPENFAALRARCSSLTNVEYMNVALGASDATARMALGKDAIGATSRIVAPDVSAAADYVADEAGTVDVPIRSGAGLGGAGATRAPTVVKIDVEGHELDCLRGLEPHLHRALGANGIRVLGIEVHFGILASRDRSGDPRKITDMLSSHGYVVTWPDASHIVAHRA
jgi:FkbM family methyltransferase